MSLHETKAYCYGRFSFACSCGALYSQPQIDNQPVSLSGVCAHCGVHFCIVGHAMPEGVRWEPWWEDGFRQLTNKLREIEAENARLKSQIQVTRSPERE